MKVRFKIRKDFQTKYMSMRGWSVNELSDLLKYKKQQVSQTLSGTTEPTMNFLHRLCNLTGLKAEEVLETVYVK